MNSKNKSSRSLVLAAALGLVVLAPMHAVAANKLIVNGTDGVTPKFVVTDTGFIGVGTNTPTKPIDVIGPDVASTQIRTSMVADTVTGGGGFMGYFNRAGGLLPKSGDRLGYFLFGSLSPGGVALNGAGVTARTEADWVYDGSPTFNVPASIAFETTDQAVGRTEKLRITGSGNLGVGTTTPSQKIEVNGGVRLNTAAAQPTCNATIGGTIWYVKGGSGVADVLQVCAKDATNTYAWKTATLQ